MRIYSNYSQPEFDAVAETAKELGFSLSAYQKYCTMLMTQIGGSTQPGTVQPLSTFHSDMISNLHVKRSGETFIVSALLPDVWPTLDRSMKMTLAKQLARYVAQNPTQYSVYESALGKTTVYQVL